MQLRSDIQLASMIQAMQKTICPAIDADNQLALEQAQLIIGTLSLMRQQQPQQFKFDCDELQRLLDCAEKFSDSDSTSAIAQAALVQLNEKRGLAAGVLAGFQLDPAELVGAIEALREAVGELITAAVAGGDASLETEAERAILSLSKQQLLRDRALLKPQGWEVNNTDLPDIASLLD